MLLLTIITKDNDVIVNDNNNTKCSFINVFQTFLFNYYTFQGLFAI